MSRFYKISNIQSVTPNSIQTGVKAIYFISLFDVNGLFEFDSNNDLNDFSLNANSTVKKITPLFDSANVAITDNNAILDIDLQGLTNTNENNLIQFDNYNNLVSIVELQNGQKLVLGIEIDKTKPFARYKTSKVDVQKSANTGKLNDSTNDLVNKSNRKFTFKNIDTLFYTASDNRLAAEQLEKINFTIPSATNLSNVTITGIEYIDTSNSLSTQSNISNSTLEVGTNTMLFGSITVLTLSSNTLSTIDLSGAISLAALNINLCVLSSLDLSKNTNLTTVNATNNSLTSLYLGNNSNLLLVKVNNNSLTFLDVSKNTSLETLFCQQNSDLDTLNLGPITSLKDLRCDNTNITSLDLSNNTELLTIRCFNTLLTSLNVDNLNSCTLLTCNSNSLTSLDVTDLTSLTTLNAYNNSITAIDLSNCTLLTTVDVRNNSMNTSQLDIILSDLDGHGLSNGSLNISGNSGSHSDTVSYNSLIAKGWIITT